MEFSEFKTNEVLDPIDVEYYANKSRTPSPTPILTTNVPCDLEDILSDVSVYSLVCLLLKCYHTLI